MRLKNGYVPFPLPQITNAPLHLASWSIHDLRATTDSSSSASVTRAELRIHAAKGRQAVWTIEHDRALHKTVAEWICTLDHFSLKLLPFREICGRSMVLRVLHDKRVWGKAQGERAQAKIMTERGDDTVAEIENSVKLEKKKRCS